MYILSSEILIISFSRKHACNARETHMGQAGTNFHSLPTCLTIYRIMLNVPVNYLKLFYNSISIVDTQIFYIIIIGNLAFVIWTHIEQIDQG